MMLRSRRAVVNMEDYASFLPRDRKESLAPPVSDWWTWRDHQVHLLRLRDSDASVRLLVVHGAGAHATALWPIASLLKGRGIDVTVVDLPLYGQTMTASRRKISYEDWITLLVDFVSAEDDGRPVVLLGASIGGMLAVEVAASSGRVAAVVATCLLDPLADEARASMTRFGSFGPIFMPLLRLVRGPVAKFPIKVSWIADLKRMGLDPRLGRLCAKDKRGGGAWVTLGFLASYMQYPHLEARCSLTPVHLMHPELDAWTSVDLSENTLRSLRCPTTKRLLRGSGHFPVEESGLQDLLSGLVEVATESVGDAENFRITPQ